MLALSCSSGWSGAALSREGAGCLVISSTTYPVWDPGSPPTLKHRALSPPGQQAANFLVRISIPQITFTYSPSSNKRHSHRVSCEYPFSPPGPALTAPFMAQKHMPDSSQELPSLLASASFTQMWPEKVKKIRLSLSRTSVHSGNQRTNTQLHLLSTQGGWTCHSSSRGRNKSSNVA